jgi:precorrin-2 dehydrogenase / sirohydrochlorin ferrochelatase
MGDLDMRYYPVYLNIAGRSCLVVGGGSVGTRKVESLLLCGAAVTVISPQVSERLAELARQGQIVLKQRDYHDSDGDDAFLVVGATDNQVLNRQLHRKCEERGHLCNIVDQPELCSFVVPSVIRQGDLSIAVSTAGKSPALARHLRRQLQAMFGPEYGTFVDLMGAIRAKLQARGHAPERHKALFEQLIRSDLLQLIKQEDHRGINTVLNRILGPDFRVQDLMEPT